MKFVFHAFENVEDLDLFGPWEVIGVAAKLGGILEPSIVSATGGTITSAKGLRFETDWSFETCPQPDIILVPGGQGVNPLLDDRPTLDWIAKVAPGCSWVTSVCSGSLVLAAAGPAQGKRITTHHGRIQQAKDQGLAGEVLSGYRYVRDGNLLTSEGVSAGIDMALWLVGELFGPDFARKVQHQMQYDPAPPYTGLT